MSPTTRIIRLHAITQTIVQSLFFLILFISGTVYFPTVAIVICGGLWGAYGICRLADRSEHLRQAEQKRQREQLAIEKERQLAIEARRVDKDSLGYRLLNQFVRIDGSNPAEDERELQPVLSVNMNQLTDYQALVIDSFLEDAEAIQKSANETAEAIPGSELHAEQVIRQAAVFVSQALQADANAYYNLAEQAIVNNGILGGMGDAVGQSYEKVLKVS